MAVLGASSLQIDSATLGSQTGSAPMFAARAWVNFNGTNTVAIRASGNVSSITDNGAGNYAVNFTTAMPDTNYAVHCTSQLQNAVANWSDEAQPGTYSTSNVAIYTGFFQQSTGNVARDHLFVHVSILR
jgi:hypothetical protein